MFTIEYYTADTGGSIFYHKTRENAAVAILDDIVYHKDVGIVKVSPWRVNFRNGDFVRIVELDESDDCLYGKFWEDDDEAGL